MKPYSEDLRNAAVKAYNDGLGSYEKVARIFQVHPKSLQGWVKMHREGLPQKLHGKGHHPPALSQSDCDRISELINENPSITLVALRKAVGVAAQLSVYWCAVRKLGFTYKKRIIAKEQQRPDIAAERLEWEQWQANCAPERIICIDESSVKTDFASLRCWSEKGKRCLGTALGRWKTHTILSYLTYEGKTDSLIFPGAVNKEIFREFMEEVLLPAASKGDVIIMDNLNVHKNSFDWNLFEAKGVKIRYTPRYSPEYNPIEMMWSKMKSDIRNAELRDFYDVWRETSGSFLKISPQMAKNWYEASGYCQ